MWSDLWHAIVMMYASKAANSTLVACIYVSMIRMEFRVCEDRGSGDRSALFLRVGTFLKKGFVEPIEMIAVKYIEVIRDYIHFFYLELHSPLEIWNDTTSVLYDIVI